MLILNKRQTEDIKFFAKDMNVLKKKQILDLLENGTLLDVDYQHLKTIYYLKLNEEIYLKIVELELLNADGSIESFNLYGIYSNTLSALNNTNFDI